MDNSDVVNTVQMINSKRIKQDYLHFYALYKHDKLNNSLSVVSSDLSTLNENLLRAFLIKRSSGNQINRLNEGSLCTINFSLDAAADDDENDPNTNLEQQSVVCYYTTLNSNLNQMDDERSDDTTGRPIDSVNQNLELTICLLTSSQVNLEFFRPELQEFCHQLPLQTFDFKLSFDEQKVNFTAYLDGWYDEVIEYLCRCVSLLGNDIALLFHLASMNRFLNISGKNESLKRDIYRFLNSCRLSELISGAKSSKYFEEPLQLGGSESSLSSSSSSSSFDLNNDRYLELILNDDENYIFSNGKGNSNEQPQLFTDCDDYCVEWAKVITEGDRLDPMFIKSIIENFKLTAVQSMNTFKRLVTDAQVNHYVLYRAFLFLKNSKQKAVLLKNAKMYDGIVSNQSAIDVIKVLEHFHLK